MSLNQVQMIPVKSLVKHNKNPRTITKDDFENLKKRMQKDPKFFEMRPLLVSSDPSTNICTIYAGNQRFEAAKSLKYKEVPCIMEYDVPADLQRERMVADNLHHGDWDVDMLANEFDDLDLIEMGYDMPPDQDAEVIDPQEEDEGVMEPGKDEDAITKLGDIYCLNKHRIICGDSTLPDCVEKCLNGDEPILMVTDPPYGVKYDPSWRKDIKGKMGVVARAVGILQNDDKVNWALAWHLFTGSVAYVWHAGKFCTEVEKSLLEAEYEIISQIVWNKQHFALSRGDYHWKHESCWYAIKKGHNHNWQGARDQSTVWEVDNLNAFGKSKDEGDERTVHSTQKPVECMARPIRNNSAEGEGVYDPFLGSGTTLIAAEMLNRTCYGIELSPAYCDIIVARWKNFMIKNGKQYLITRNGEKVE